MDILLAAVRESELTSLMRERGERSSHTLTDDPAGADLILLAGHSVWEPHQLLDHPLYRSYPDKCAVYTDEDLYLPLLPGVYCSPMLDAHSRAGRIFSWSYVCASGQFANRYVAKASADKKLLFSFQGGSTSFVRKRLYGLKFNRPDVLIEDTTNYRHWLMDQPGREARQQAYAETIASSHFVLCPRGAGTGSYRLFEVMQAGVAPVLIADPYPLPPHVPWDTFLLRIAEKDIHRLPELLEPHLSTSAERGRLAREAWLNYFTPEKEFDTIVALAAASLRHGPPAEAAFRRRQKGTVFRFNLRHQVRGVARSAVLKTLNILHLKWPYRLNR